MVCPVIDHKFRHHIVKVAVEPSGSADYFDNVMTKFIVNNRTDALNQFVFYDNKLSNFPLSVADALHEFQIHVSLPILTIKN